MALIEIEFIYGVDPDRRYDEVVREINVVRPILPADIFSIDIRQFTPGTVNIVQFALASTDASWREMKQQAERLEDLLETVPGVRRSDTWAYPQPEVRVAIDLERLAGAGVTLGQVIAAVQGENASIPGGAVDVGLRRYNLKTSGSYQSLAEVGDTVIHARAGRVVRLRDIAEISWSAEEERYTGRFNGNRAAFVTASMKDDQNVFEVRDAIFAQLDAYQAALPEGMRLERGFDQSRNVDRRLSRLQLDFSIAIGLVILTLLPLGLRAAGIVMISIPLSLAIGLAAIHLARILAEPAIDRRLRRRAWLAGGRLHRRGREHRATCSRRHATPAGSHCRHRPDLAGGAGLHRHAVAGLRPAAVPARGRG